MQVFKISCQKVFNLLVIMQVLFYNFILPFYYQSKAMRGDHVIFLWSCSMVEIHHTEAASLLE